MIKFNDIAVNIFIVDSSPLLRNSKFLKREVPESGGDSDLMNSTDEVLFRDYLKQQIDHLMTGDAGRDGVAEGRRGTHVEVLYCLRPAVICSLLLSPTVIPPPPAFSQVRGCAGIHGKTCGGTVQCALLCR